MREGFKTKEDWEVSNPNGNYENRKVMYADPEYLRYLEEYGPLVAKGYREVNPLKTMSGAPAGQHRRRRDKLFTEIKEGRVEQTIPPGGFRAGEEVPTSGIGGYGPRLSQNQNPEQTSTHSNTVDSGQDTPYNSSSDDDNSENPSNIHDHHQEAPNELLYKLSGYGNKEFQRLVVHPNHVLLENPEILNTMLRIIRRVAHVNLNDELSTADKLGFEQNLIDSLPNDLMNEVSGIINQDAAQQITRDIVAIAHKDIGYTRGGGRRYEVRPENINDPERGNSYADVLHGVDSMHTTATLAYHRKRTGDPNAEIPVGQEFDKLTKKWGKLQQAAYYAAIYGLPAAGAIGVGIATGGLSWWAHGLAVAAGLGGGALASAAANKAGSESGSRLRDIQLLGGLKELKKGLNNEGYLAPPKYNVAHEALRSLFGKTPQRSVRHLNITKGDLNYILKRGEASVENGQKKARIVMTIMSLLAGGWAGLHYHSGGVAETLSQPIVTPTTPETLTTNNVTGSFRDLWGSSIAEFFTFDGTMPKLNAPKIPNCCWGPTTL